MTFSGLDDMGNVATIVQLFLGAAGVTALTAGLRVGPMRAMTLAYKSRFFGGPLFRVSVRKSEIDRLRTDLDSLVDLASYVVVKGDKGIGKSCMIDTALHGMKGVVRTKISPDTSEVDVLKQCYRKITGGPGFTFFDEEANVKRVLFWYKSFHGSSPTVVMAMSERTAGSGYAQVTGAVRTLAELGVRVIVDASPNSAPPDLTTTKRQIEINISVMTSDQMRSIPELRALFRRLDPMGLSEVVLELIGGNPADFHQLARVLAKSDCTDIPGAVEAFLVERVVEADRRLKAMLPGNQKFKKIFELLGKQKPVATSELSERDLQLPTPCKVLRMRTLDDGNDVVVPSSPLVSLLLQHSSDVPKTKLAVHKMIHEAASASAARAK